MFSFDSFGGQKKWKEVVCWWCYKPAVVSNNGYFPLSAAVYVGAATSSDLLLLFCLLSLVGAVQSLAASLVTVANLDLRSRI